MDWTMDYCESSETVVILYRGEACETWCIPLDCDEEIELAELGRAVLRALRD